MKKATSKKPEKVIKRKPRNAKPMAAAPPAAPVQPAVLDKAVQAHPVDYVPTQAEAWAFRGAVERAKDRAELEGLVASRVAFLRHAPGIYAAVEARRAALK